MVKVTKSVRARRSDARVAEDAGADRRAKYAALPPRPAPDELVEEAPTDPPGDPQMGRDSDRDWMLRYS
jgi:hypothetical protein